MSQFSGPQEKGAMKYRRAVKRREAEERNARTPNWRRSRPRALDQALVKIQADATAFVAAVEAASKSVTAFAEAYTRTLPDTKEA